MRTLTPDEARAFYDRFGSRQDDQTFYEESALKLLVANASLESARSVFEFGCGTGRFAAELLHRHLSSTAHYSGIDLSATMVRLATERLSQFGPRATVSLAPEEPALPLRDSSVDRFISTYVFDLLSEAALIDLLNEAHRTLVPGGLLCVAGITRGKTLLSRVVMSAWNRLFSIRPSLVGGCRPIELLQFLRPGHWKIHFHTVVDAWGVASEVVIASPETFRAACEDHG